MYNNYGYGNKNKFDFGNEYNDFLKKQEADRNKLDNTFDEYLRSAREMSSNAGANKKKTYFGTTPNLNSFGDDMSAYSKVDTSSWNNNYGTGTAFTDSWRFNNDVGSYAQDEYDKTQSLLKQHKDNYDSVFDEYKRIAGEVSRNNQKAAIQKNQNLLNMKNMSTASGRGGLGSTVTGYRRADNNFMNTVNENNNYGNDSANALRNQFSTEFDKYLEAAKLLEKQARDEYGDVLIRDLNYQLKGHEDSDMPGWLDAAKSYNPLTYLNEDGSTQSVDSYITAENEQRLIDHLNGLKEKNKYFLYDKDSDDIFEKYRQEIKNLGSNNKEYQSANKYIEKQPESYTKRGAVSNIAASSVKYDSDRSINQVKYNNQNYILSSYDKQLDSQIKNKYPKAGKGDVVVANNSKYLNYLGKWYKMNTYDEYNNLLKGSGIPILPNRYR